MGKVEPRYTRIIKEKMLAEETLKSFSRKLLALSIKRFGRLFSWDFVFLTLVIEAIPKCLLMCIERMCVKLHHVKLCEIGPIRVFIRGTIYFPTCYICKIIGRARTPLLKNGLSLDALIIMVSRYRKYRSINISFHPYSVYWVSHSRARKIPQILESRAFWSRYFWNPLL